MYRSVDGHVHRLVMAVENLWAISRFGATRLCYPQPSTKRPQVTHREGTCVLLVESRLINKLTGSTTATVLDNPQRRISIEVSVEVKKTPSLGNKKGETTT